MTFAIFHDFPGLENGLPKFHDQRHPVPHMVGPSLHMRGRTTLKVSKWRKLETGKHTENLFDVCIARQWRTSTIYRAMTMLVQQVAHIFQ